MSIWGSLELAAHPRTVDGGDLDVAVTKMHPDHPAAVRVCTLDVQTTPEVYLELSFDDAVRLRDALDLAVVELAPAGEPPPAPRWR